jgi:glycerophosphoryl diester phosphodiesterase
MGSPLIMGHRGLTERAVENSRESVEKAIEHGLAGIEVDIQPTADHEWVCFHDSNLLRLTGLNRQLATVNSGEIKTMTFKSADHSNKNAHYGKAIFYEELLDLGKDTLLLNIEIKGHFWRKKNLIEKLIKPLRNKGMVDQVIFSSFSPWTLLRLGQIARDLRLGVLLRDPDKMSTPLWSLRLIKPYSIHPPLSRLNAHAIKKWRDKGYRIFTWTINDQEVYDAMCGLGVDGIITDFPLKFMKGQSHSAVADYVGHSKGGR